MKDDNRTHGERARDMMLRDVDRLRLSRDPRDVQRREQALRDAVACMESRRAGPCDCFCCRLWVVSKGVA